jgi:hypothetical protein
MKPVFQMLPPPGDLGRLETLGWFTSYWEARGVRNCEMSGPETMLQGLAHSREQGPDLRLGWRPLGGTLTSNLLIRSSMYGWPEQFRSVRDLGLVSARCSSESEVSEGRSRPWLPAWLRAAEYIRNHRPGARHRKWAVYRHSLGLSVRLGW